MCWVCLPGLRAAGVLPPQWPGQLSSAPWLQHPAWSRTRHALRGDSRAGQRKNSLHTTREKYHQAMNKIVTNIFLHIYVLLWTCPITVWRNGIWRPGAVYTALPASEAATVFRTPATERLGLGHWDTGTIFYISNISKVKQVWFFFFIKARQAGPCFLILVQLRLTVALT